MNESLHPKEDRRAIVERIATTDHSPLRVLAGPGTGKTYALMQRVKRLLEEGVNPESILVCTFTRTAARDLQAALTSLGVQEATHVKAGTLHSVCFSLLSRAAVFELTGRVPRTLLNFEERFLLEDVKGATNETVRDLRRRLEAFNAAWARLQSDMPGWPQDPQDRTFHAALDSWLRFHQAMLVGELVPQALLFIRSNPASADRPRFAHVLVDEYQDLNKAEQVLVDELAAGGSLTVIGDENQSIYTSFRYAHPEGIAHFDREHPGTHDEGLDECMRCPRLVVHMANALIANNIRSSRRLRPWDSNPEGEVYLVQWQTMQEEAGGIAAFIRSRIQTGSVSPGNVLVLAPRRQLGYAVRDALASLGIPSQSLFYEEALEGDPTKRPGCEVQEAFTLLTLLARPNDRVALRAWCGFGSASLQSGAWARLRDHCEQTGEDPRSTLEALAAGGLRLPRTKPLVDRYQKLQLRLQTLTGLRGDKLLNAVFPAGAQWAEPLRTLARELSPDEDPVEVLDVLRRAITQPELPTEVDYVRVMSLHKAKGLTANLVVVLGCVQGLIPTLGKPATLQEQHELLEEQRRLFYVAVTRTRHTLVLSSVASLPRDLAYRMGAIVPPGRGKVARTISSQFLGQLGPECPNIEEGSKWLARIGVSL